MNVPTEEAEARVAQLVGLTDRLTVLLDRETRAFEARRPQDVLSGQEETQRLANLYRHESARIKADPGLIAAASAGARRRLSLSVQAFEGVLARHGRAVAAAKAVTEGLVQAIAAEVAAQRTSVSPYGPGARAGAPSATAFALNRRA